MASPQFFFTILALITTTISAHNIERHRVVNESGVMMFSYNGSNGPKNWGRLSPNYSACSTGKAQSPISIVKHKVSVSKKLKPLIRHYSPTVNATLLNNGFNVGIRFEGNAGGMNVDGKNYSLLQMHWHSPSEHRLDGHLCEAELHMVHKADDGSLSVIATLYKYGKADPLLAKMQSKLSELCKEGNDRVGVGIISTKYMRRKTRKYFRYMGSLTTPPCTENVTWHILGKVKSISKQQVKALKAPLGFDYKYNSRPVQALNGRKIELYHQGNK